MTAAGSGPRPALRVLSPREASIFACLCDTVVAPEPALPAVRETDAVASFDRLLAASPRLNRVALRALLHAAELGPRALGFGARLRRLDGERRGRALASLEESRDARVRALAQLLKNVACLSYYGDDKVMRQLGYDPDERTRRGRRLRLREGRP